MPLETGFWACATTTVRGRVQTASRVVPSLDLIRESPVKGMLAAAEFCTGKLLPSRLDWCMRLLLPLALLIGATSTPGLGQSNAERIANDAYTRSRLRPGAPANRGPELRLGLDIARRPRDDHAGGAAAGARFRDPRRGQANRRVARRRRPRHDAPERRPRRYARG